jgi:hypothetical protein
MKADELKSQAIRNLENQLEQAIRIERSIQKLNQELIDSYDMSAAKTTDLDVALMRVTSVKNRIFSDLYDLKYK